MLVEGAFNLLFRAGMRRDFRDNYPQGEEEWSQFLNRGTMDLPEMSATIFTGLSRMYEIGDGEPVRFDAPKIGPKVMGVDKEFGVGVAIGKKIVEDDQYGKMKEAAKWMANAARQTYEYRGASFLDDAFTGTFFKGIDGKKLIASDHTFLNASGTWSNLAPAVGVSYTGITNIMDAFNVMKNHDGDPITMSMDKLVIGNNQGDMNRAWQVFNSKQEPFTTDNQDNAIKHFNGSVKVVVSKYKVSSKSYFGIASKWNDAELRIRRAVRMEDDFDFKTGAALYKTTTRFMIWFVDPRGWVGANPV